MRGEAPHDVARPAAAAAVAASRRAVCVCVCVAAAKIFSSNWRLAGLNYLEMINVASVALRRVMKEPTRTEALSAAKFHYREFTYPNGAESEPGTALSSPACPRQRGVATSTICPAARDARHAAAAVCRACAAAPIV